jgi:MFS family permease
LRALNHADFRLFFIGQLISLVGSWMQTVGQSWLILTLTNSPFLLSLISTLQFLPMLLLSLVAGAVTDRFPKRKLIIGTQMALMLQALILSALVWSGHVRYWHVAVLALSLGLVNTLDMPARQSFFVEMVGKGDLMNAIALNGAMFNGARIVGPAVAGLLIARYGVGLGFFLNGISFLAVIAALFLIKAEGLPKPRTSKNMGQEIREGLQYVARTPLTFLILSLVGTVSLFVINFTVLIPLLAKQVLHQEAQGFGLLMSAMGLGALGGALTLALTGKGRPSLRSIFIPGAVLSLAALIVAFQRQVPFAAVMLAVVGFAQILFSAGGNTLLQVTTPDELRGRVMSLYLLVFAGSTPIGAFFIGIISERWGAPAGWWSAGGLGLVSVVVIALWWRLRHGADRRGALTESRGGVV